VGKPPYFPTYVQETLSAPWLAAMRPEQLGAIFLLRMYQWDDPTCSLPNDPGILRYLSRLGDRWDEFGPDIVRLAFKAEDGRIYMEDLRVARSKYDAAASSGARGGKARAARIVRKPRPTEGLRKAPARVAQGSTKARPTKPDNEIRDTKAVNGETENGSSPAVAGAAALAPTVEEKPWNLEATEVWERHLGSVSAGKMGGRIGAALKPLLAKHGWRTVCAVWERACEQAAAEPEGADYFTPEIFARTFVARMKAPPARAGPKARPTVGSQTADVIREIARREGKG
jgi:hypothetical protein